jgi:hypothetical protein
MNVFLGFRSVEAFVCRERGEGVSIERPILERPPRMVAARMAGGAIVCRHRLPMAPARPSRPALL